MTGCHGNVMEMSATYPAIIYVVVVCCLYFCPKTNQIRYRYEKISDDDDLDRACGKLELDVDRPTRLSRFIVFERGLTRDKHCRRETLDKGGGG
jgi:hypothetical protein